MCVVVCCLRVVLFVFGVCLCFLGCRCLFDYFFVGGIVCVCLSFVVCVVLFVFLLLI